MQKLNKIKDNKYPAKVIQSLTIPLNIPIPIQ